MNEIVSMNDRQFKFGDHPVRTHVDENGKVWFVAQDVCKALGLRYVGSALKRINDADRGSIRYSTQGGIQDFVTVNEPGLYRLVLRSDRSEADKFIDWVTREVLPSIRKTGQYSIQPQETLTPLQQLKAMVAYMEDQERKRDERIREVNEKLLENKIIAERAERQDNDTLTHDQISQLDALIQVKAKECGDVKNTGLIRKAIKDEFFEIKGSRTYKEIPRSGFEKALSIVKAYRPPAWLKNGNRQEH